MLKLSINPGPRWLDLGHGVRLHVLPLTSQMMIDVGRDPALAEVESGAPEMNLAFAKAVARVAVTGWEGVGDDSGEPMEVSPEAVDALLDIWPLYNAFRQDFVLAGLAVVAEGNVFAPSPNGTSAAGATTAGPALSPAQTAPAS